MAASCPNAVRVRLYFDYPPPGMSDCRMCWVLVDLNKCRVVADLASIIRDKFDFSRRAVLNLFIEDCYLPPAESVYVVRDNDNIRVKVDVLPQVNGCEFSSDAEETLKAKKRGREGEEESEDEDERVVKKRKKSAKSQETQEMRVALAEEEMATKKKKKKKKKRKKKMKPQTEGHGGPMTCLEDEPEAPTLKEVLPPTAPTNCKVVPQKRGSSSSESSDEEEAPKTVVPVRAPVKTGSQVPAKTAKLKGFTWDSDSSGTAAPSRKPSLQAAPGSALVCSPAPSSTRTLRPRPLVPGSTSITRKQADSSSSESSETELVIKRPPPAMQGILGAVSRGRGGPPGRSGPPAVGRGVGRGNPPRRDSGPRGGGRGGRGLRGPWGAEGQNNFYDNRNGTREQYLEETLTNRAVVLQTPPAAVPPRDYTTMPLLAAPPAVGQTIAFKLLELTESYTPEVSDYKEGKIVGFDQNTNQVHVQLLSSVPAPTGPGKFDLVYQAPDGSEVIESALSHGSQLTERWESLLEPRLVVENVG